MFTPTHDNVVVFLLTRAAVMFSAALNASDWLLVFLSFMKVILTVFFSVVMVWTYYYKHYYKHIDLLESL